MVRAVDKGNAMLTVSSAPSCGNSEAIYHFTILVLWWLDYGNTVPYDCHANRLTDSDLARLTT